MDGVQGLVGIVLGEISLVLASLRRNQRWSASIHMGDDAPPESALVSSLKELRNNLLQMEAQDDAEMQTLVVLRPFLEVILSKETSGPITGVALCSVKKFLHCGVVDHSPEQSIAAVKSIVHAVTHTKFEATDASSDEVVLMQLIEVLLAATMLPTGRLLPGRLVLDIVRTCFRIGAQPRLGALLRATAEDALHTVARTAFARLPKLVARALTDPGPPTGVDVSWHGDLLQVFCALAWGGPADSPGGAISGAVGARAMSPTSTRDVSPSSPLSAPAFDTSPNPSSTSITETVGSGIAAPLDASTSASSATGPNGQEGADGDATGPGLGDGAFAAPPQDDASQLLGLQLIAVALESVGPAVSHIPSLIAVIRREVCPRLFYCARARNLLVLALVFRIITLLYRCCARHLKLELGVFVTAVLQHTAGSTSSSFEQVELALESLLTLARIPSFGADLYYNYDCDVQLENVFEGVCKFLSKTVFPITGRLTAIHMLSLDALLGMVQSLTRITTGSMRASSPLGDRMRGYRSLVHDEDGHAELELAKLQSAETDLHPTPVSPQGQATKETEDQQPVIVPFAPIEFLSAATLRQQRQRKRLLSVGAGHFNRDSKKGLAFLQSSRILADPLDSVGVAQFLRHTATVDKARTGAYLGEPSDFHLEVLTHFVELFDFKQLRIDAALRLFLSSFLLPGEAQKIGRIMEAFAQAYWKQNPGPLANADAAYLLAYSVIMLHTDHHNRGVKRKMTVDQFVRNNRGINGGDDLPKQLLVELFDSITTNEIRLPYMMSGPAMGPESRWTDAMGPQAMALEIGGAEAVAPGFQATFVPASSDAPGFGKDMFHAIWGPSVAAFSVAFDACDASDEATLEKCIQGFALCARVAAYYQLTDIFDNLIIALCKMSGLVSGAGAAGARRGGGRSNVDPVSASAAPHDSGEFTAAITPSGEGHSHGRSGDTARGGGSRQIHAPSFSLYGADAGGVDGYAADYYGSGATSGTTPVRASRRMRQDDRRTLYALGHDRKAQRAAGLLFQLARELGDAIREGWRSLVECVLRLRRLNLIPPIHRFCWMVSSHAIQVQVQADSRPSADARATSCPTPVPTPPVHPTEMLSDWSRSGSDIEFAFARSEALSRRALIAKTGPDAGQGEPNSMQQNNASSWWSYLGLDSGTGHGSSSDEDTTGAIGASFCQYQSIQPLSVLPDEDDYQYDETGRALRLSEAEAQARQWIEHCQVTQVFSRSSQLQADSLVYLGKALILTSVSMGSVRVPNVSAGVVQTQDSGHLPRSASDGLRVGAQTQVQQEHTRSISSQDLAAAGTDAKVPSATDTTEEQEVRKESSKFSADHSLSSTCTATPAPGSASGPTSAAPSDGEGYVVVPATGVGVDQAQAQPGGTPSASSTLKAQAQAQMQAMAASPYAGRAPANTEAAVFCTELLTAVALSNRRRIFLLWLLVYEHLNGIITAHLHYPHPHQHQHLATPHGTGEQHDHSRAQDVDEMHDDDASTPPFIGKRAVTCLLRLCVRVAQARGEIADQLVRALRLLGSLTPAATVVTAPRIAAAVRELCRVTTTIPESEAEADAEGAGAQASIRVMTSLPVSNAMQLGPLTLNPPADNAGGDGSDGDAGAARASALHHMPGEAFWMHDDGPLHRNVGAGTADQGSAKTLAPESIGGPKDTEAYYQQPPRSLSGTAGPGADVGVADVPQWPLQYSHSTRALSYWDSHEGQYVHVSLSSAELLVFRTLRATSSTLYTLSHLLVPRAILPRLESALLSQAQPQSESKLVEEPPTDSVLPGAGDDGLLLGRLQSIDILFRPLLDALGLFIRGAPVVPASLLGFDLYRFIHGQLTQSALWQAAFPSDGKEEVLESAPGQRGCVPAASSSPSSSSVSAATVTLDVWLLLCQAIAQCCTDRRATVRAAGLKLLQEVLLDASTEALPASAWQRIIQEVLFALFEAMLSPHITHARTHGDMEDTRLRLCAIFTQIVLQYLSKLRQGPHFSAVWMRSLWYMETVASADQSALLAETVPEYFLNMLLALAEAQVLGAPPTTSASPPDTDSPSPLQTHTEKQVLADGFLDPVATQATWAAVDRLIPQARGDVLRLLQPTSDSVSAPVPIKAVQQGLLEDAGAGVSGSEKGTPVDDDPSPPEAQ